MASPKYRSAFVEGLLQQGAVKSKVEDLLKVIKARGLELTQAQFKLVTSCADLNQLAAWFDQALDAKTTDEIFGAHYDLQVRELLRGVRSSLARPARLMVVSGGPG